MLKIDSRLPTGTTASVPSRLETYEPVISRYWRDSGAICVSRKLGWYFKKKFIIHKFINYKITQLVRIFTLCQRAHGRAKSIVTAAYCPASRIKTRVVH